MSSGRKDFQQVRLWFPRIQRELDAKVAPLPEMPWRQESFKPVSALEKLIQVRFLASLKRDAWNQGIYFQGRILKPPCKVWNLGTILVGDEAGDTICVNMTNVILTTDTEEILEAVYPQGAEIIIKEPWMIRDWSMGGSSIHLQVGLILVVANPQAVVVSYGNHLQKDAKILHEAGNTKFKQGKYLQAIDLYTKSVEAASRSSDLDNKQLILTYSNRSETWLKLERFGKALDDADAALNLSKEEHGKSAYRKARALLGMKMYVEACPWYDKAVQMETDPSNKASLAKEARQAVEFREQSLGRGEFDFSQFLVDGNRETAPKFADYIGNLEVKTSPSKGRGVFLTKNVRKGDLLMAMNSVMLVRDGRELLLEQINYRRADWITKLARACMDSPKVLAQVYSLAFTRDGAVGRETPDMDIYRPNTRVQDPVWEENCASIDILRIQGAMDTNTEHMVIPPSYKTKDCTGMWPLLSLVNHSCVPNVSTFHVGYGAVFMVASRDMEAGQEVLRAYERVVQPISKARCCLDKGFVCQRCDLENRLNLAGLAKTMQVVQDLAMSVDAPTKQVGDAVKNAFLEVVVQVETKIQASNLDEFEAAGIRASFSNAYKAYYMVHRLMYGEVDIMPSTREFMKNICDIAPGELETLEILQQIYNRGLTPQEQVEFGRPMIEDQIICRYGHQKARIVKNIADRFCGNLVCVKVP